MAPPVSFSLLFSLRTGLRPAALKLPNILRQATVDHVHHDTVVIQLSRVWVFFLWMWRRVPPRDLSLLHIVFSTFGCKCSGWAHNDQSNRCALKPQ